MEVKAAEMYHLIPVRMSNIKKPKSTSIGKDVEIMEPWYTVGNANWLSYYEKYYGISSKFF